MAPQLSQEDILAQAETGGQQSLGYYSGLLFIIGTYKLIQHCSVICLLSLFFVAVFVL